MLLRQQRDPGYLASLDQRINDRDPQHWVSLEHTQRAIPEGLSPTMGSAYDLYVRHEVYLAIGSIKNKPRGEIIRFLESLSSDPFQKGDYQDRTPEGREIQVKVIGSYALLYWVDHPVREVKVVDLVQADV